jgi:predicted DNA-binding transcriptional regulator AlpA
VFTSDNTSSQAFLSIRDIVALTGISRSTIYRMRAKGDFPTGHLQWGKVHRWPQDDVLKWLHALISQKRERKEASYERKKEHKRLKARVKPPGWKPKPRGRPKKRGRKRIYKAKKR